MINGLGDSTFKIRGHTVSNILRNIYVFAIDKLGAEFTYLVHIKKF